jgi:hypothetical protein
VDYIGGQGFNLYALDAAMWRCFRNTLSVAFVFDPLQT